MKDHCWKIQSARSKGSVKRNLWPGEAKHSKTIPYQACALSFSWCCLETKAFNPRRLLLHWLHDHLCLSELHALNHKTTVITKVTCKWPLHDTKIAPFWGMILEGVGCTWKHRIKYYSTVIMCILLYVILYDFVFFSSWQTQKVEFADWHVSLRSKVGFEWWVSGWRRHHGTLQPNAYCPDLSWIEGLASSELECKCIVQKKQNIYSTCAHFRTRSMQRFILRRNVMVPAMWKRNL